MRTPDFEIDGWCLDDAEDIHQDAPKTFYIPELKVRQSLQPGDYAKLIFRIAVAGEEPVSVERMWVIVRAPTPDGYVGMLDNEPDAIAENDRFWVGTELAFEYRHVIAVQRSTPASTALALAPVPIPWKD
jgi:hypothetical protein